MRVKACPDPLFQSLRSHASLSDPFASIVVVVVDVLLLAQRLEAQVRVSDDLIAVHGLATDARTQSVGS